MGEPEAKKSKLTNQNAEINLTEKLKLSSLIATQIGIVKSPHLTKCGTPHQPGQLETISTIYLNQGKIGGKDLTDGDQRWMPRDVLDGLEEYSHCWILFHFHLNDAQSNGRKSKVAPPRGGGTKVGIFASRAPYRPSPIGLSLVKIIKINKDNGTIDIQNCDLVNETPVLDIKPYFPEYDIPKDEEKAKTANWLQSANEESSSICVGNGAKELKEKIVKLVTNDPRSLHR